MSRPPHDPNESGHAPNDRSDKHLLMQAMRESRVAADLPRVDPLDIELQQQREHLRRTLLMIAGIIVVIGGVAGGVWYNRNQATARQRALLRDATAAVTRAVTQADFAAARNAAREAVNNGLSNESGEALRAEIDEAAKDYALELVAKIRVLSTDHKWADAGALLKKAEQTSGHADVARGLGELRKIIEIGPGRDLVAHSKVCAKDAKWKDAFADLAKVRSMPHDRAELSKWEQQLIAQAGGDLYARSSAALKAGDSETAMALYEEATQLPGGDTEERKWAAELKNKVAGRVRVRTDGAEARVSVGAVKGRSDTVLMGIPAGSALVTVSAPGYLPEQRSIQVAFPTITAFDVKLTPAAPDARWAAFILGHDDARAALAAYYSAPAPEAHATGAPPAPVDSSADSSAGKSTRGEGAKLSEKEIEKEVAKLNSDKLPPHACLERLGRLKRTDAEAYELLRVRCRERVEACVQLLERACADCLSVGTLRCAACDGRGKRKELRPCTGCQATGRKPCTVCGGSMRAKCKVCGGSGKVRHSSTVSSGGPLATNLHSTSPCGACSGTGKGPCTNLKCRQGRLTCAICSGQTRAELMGPCLACEGLGGTPCRTCSATGRRDEMAVDQRRRAELAAVAAD